MCVSHLLHLNTVLTSTHDVGESSRSHFHHDDLDLVVLTPSAQLPDARSVKYFGSTSMTVIRDAVSSIKEGEFGQFVHRFIFAAESLMRYADAR
jgi:hypothetical protein